MRTKQLRVLGVSGSPRAEGNTDLILGEALKAAKLNGAETKLIRLSDFHLEPCNACMACFKTGKCVIVDDGQALYEEVTNSDSIILASPSYFQGVTAQMKTFIDRVGFLALARKRQDFIGKVGGAIAVARRSGVSSTCNQMMTFLTALGVAIPSGGRVYAIGREIGEVLNDQEGIETARQLGNAMVKALN
jgi:multimeric flavodoxin WrbA